MDAAGDMKFGIAACAAAAAAETMAAGDAAATGLGELGELVAGLIPFEPSARFEFAAPAVFAFPVVPEAEPANCCRV